MLAVGDQVEVVGELDGLGQLLQDVDAEALTAAFDVNARVPGLVAESEDCGRGRGSRGREEEGNETGQRLSTTSSRPGCPFQG